jgi:hypothetical protein
MWQHSRKFPWLSNLHFIDSQILFLQKCRNESVSKTLKNDDIKNIVGSIVREILSDHKKDMEPVIDEKHKALTDIIDS